MRSLSVVIVILVASIPIAIEVVCTSTLAVGSRRLAQKKVIIARLSAIEELAGMTILCSDKTGTLTLNKLGLRDPILLAEGTTANVRIGERDRGYCSAGRVLRGWISPGRSANFSLPLCAGFFPPVSSGRYLLRRAGLQARPGQPGRHRLLHHKRE